MKPVYITLVAVIAVIVAIFSFRGCTRNKSDNNDVAYMLKHKTDSVKYWHDQYNAEHARTTSISGNYDELATVYYQELDSSAKRAGIDKKQIEGLQNLVAKIKGGFAVKVIHDTTAIVFSYKDSTMQETAVISNDTAHVTYDVTVLVHLTQYWHRSWLLGKKVHYVDGYSDNPNVHITNLQSIRIEGREPGRFGIGPYVGISLNGPSIGIALTYSLIRF